MNFLVWVTILLTAIKADWPVFLWGRCPSRVRGTPNFNVNRYLKRWYQQSALPQFYQDSSDRCVTAEYTPLSDRVIGVYNSAVDKNGDRSGVRGEAALTSKTRGELNVAFFSTASTKAKPNYIVLDTDYTSFTYIWGCSNVGFVHQASFWILTRESNPSVATVKHHENEAIKILRRFGYRRSFRKKLKKTVHNCD